MQKTTIKINASASGFSALKAIRAAITKYGMPLEINLQLVGNYYDGHHLSWYGGILWMGDIIHDSKYNSGRRTKLYSYRVKTIPNGIRLTLKNYAAREKVKTKWAKNGEKVITRAQLIIKSTAIADPNAELDHSIFISVYEWDDGNLMFKYRKKATLKGHKFYVGGAPVNASNESEVISGFGTNFEKAE